MSAVFIRLGQGASVSFKDGVATAANLPTQGNNIGDVRSVLSPASIWLWDGTMWVNTDTGGGGGGTPGGPNSSIQFNNGGAFAGDSQLEWDNTGKILNLNGLAIHSLSSTVSLVNNQPSPVTAFIYSASTYNFSVIEFSLTRSTSKAVGIILVANDSSTATLTQALADLNADLGVTFSASVSGGNVNIQYSTTNTGFNASLKYSIRQWI